MPISDKSYRVIWGQFAGRCFMCREQLIERTDGGTESLTGEVAHIVGEKKGAARGSSSLSEAERNHPDNLVLACRKHHKMIDDDPSTYSVAWLEGKKQEHIEWVESGLAEARPWASNLDQMIYINVPRLSEQAVLRGFRVDLSKYRDGASLSSLGWDLNHVMAAFDRVLAHLPLEAVSSKELSLHEGHIGALISFDRVRFRTKNVEVDRSRPISGNLDVDPHVYYRDRGFKVVANIDGRWITTSTAFSLFRSGQCVLSGLARVTNVDYESGVVTVTPLVLGLSQPRSSSSLQPESASATEANANSSKLDAIADIEEGRRRGVYFSPSPEVCDLCCRLMSAETYMIDGAISRGGPWACMCPACFFERDGIIGWGKGQLYKQDGRGWLQVGGFQPTATLVNE